MEETVSALGRSEVVREIFEAIRRANELRAPEEQLAYAEETCLYGSEGGLDSLGLVSLVVDLEELINTRSGIRVVIASEHALSQNRSPFHDVASLADYVTNRLLELGQCPPNPSCS